MSRTRASGSSNAAKWPPLSKVEYDFRFHCCRSQASGAWKSSLGKTATAEGTCKQTVQRCMKMMLVTSSTQCYNKSLLCHMGRDVDREHTGQSNAMQEFHQECIDSSHTCNMQGGPYSDDQGSIHSSILQVVSETGQGDDTKPFPY